MKPIKLLKTKFIELFRMKIMKLLFLTILIALFFNLIYATGFSQEIKVKFYVFSSPECENCEEFKNEYLPKMFEKYEQKIEVKILDVLNQEEYLLWNRFSEKLNYSDPLLPTVVINDVMLSGLDEIETRLEAEIDRILKEGGCEFPEVETEEEPTEVIEETTKVTEEAKELYVAYFYQPGCKKCGSVFYLLNQLKDRYANLVVKEYDTLDSKNIKLFESLCERNGVEKENWLKAPAIFIGDDYLIEGEINLTNVEELIKKYLKIGADSPEHLAKNYLEKAPKNIIERFKGYTIFPLILAGIIDGFNPCAFATIIFFISYLTYIGRSKREIILIGISFSLAVFLAYLLLGVGFLRIITSLKAFSAISRIVYIITALIALVLGVLNFVDYFRAKKGQINKTILQLPMFLKREIHKTIRKGSKARSFFISAFLVGLVVSILEFACTGQVYLPTITYILTIPNLKFKGYFFLILYNLMFILPLIIIFILYYIGASSKKIENFLRSNVAKVKLITGLFFLILSVFLIINAIL
ncbi:MAG: hypothetical protein ABIA56_04645 [Actinomycetota bacterium]